MQSTHFTWLGQYLVMLVVGVVLVFVLHLLTPGRLIRYTGVLPYRSPNWDSIIRVPISLVGLYLIFSSHGKMWQLWTGFVLTIVGAYMDSLDGKKSKHLIGRLRFLTEFELITKTGEKITASPEVEKNSSLTKSGEIWAWYEVEELNEEGYRVKRQKMVVDEAWLNHLMRPYTRLPMFRIEPSRDPRYPGRRLSLTRLGESIDPAADKHISVLVFTYTACTGFVFPFVAVPMIISDLISSVFRKPFDRLPVFRHLQKLVIQQKASAFGKTKVIWQYTAIFLLIPAAAGWLTQEEMYWSRVLASGVLGLAVFAGVLSTLSRLSLWENVLKLPGLRRFNKNFKEVFDHSLDD